MADCFSLPNAAELVEELRAWSGCVIYGDNCDECGKEEEQERRFCRQQQETMFIAANDIEALLAENAKLKAAFDECYAANEDLFRKLEEMKQERDAAVDDLKDLAYCSKCFHEDKYPISNPCCVCHGDKWEWRGAHNA